MRGLMISITIILFCLSVNIVNTVDANYQADKGRSLFGFRVSSPLNYSDLNGVQNDPNANSTIRDFATPVEQPSGLGLQELYAVGVMLFKGIEFIVNTMIDSSLRFYWWVQNFGTGYTFVPQYIAFPLAVIINICHVMVIFQVISNRNLKTGGA